MNTSLAKKILDKLSLKDLYDEIKSNDQMIYNLGTIFAAKKKSLFCKLMREVIEKAIKAEDSNELTEFFKTEIIEMDGPETISINSVTKRKTATSPLPLSSSKSVESDPCSRGGGVRSSC